MLRDETETHDLITNRTPQRKEPLQTTVLHDLIDTLITSLVDSLEPVLDNALFIFYRPKIEKSTTSDN